MPRVFIIIFAILAVLGASARASAQTHITLREQADVSQRQPTADQATDGSAIRLSDIADLDGPEADTLAQAIIVPGGRAASRGQTGLVVTIADVRKALDAAGANWGRVSLSGSACSVRTSIVPPPEPRAAALPKTVKAAPQPIDTAAPTTIRKLIGLRLAEHYGVEIADLRLLFDENDENILSMSPGNRRVDIEPSGGPGSPRIPVNVSVYDGARIAVSKLITATAQVQRTVVTATNVIDRGQTITEDLVSAQRQWISPGGKAMATPEQVAGAVTTQRIASGQIIAQTDITTPIIVKRGEIVYVHAVNGGFIVKAKARALGSARDGEYVQLKLDGSEHVFTAKMSGRGRAVMMVDNDEADVAAAQGPAVDAAGAGAASDSGTRVILPPARARPSSSISGASR